MSCACTTKRTPLHAQREPHFRTLLNENLSEVELALM
jgi:hypothetical protein